MPSYLSDENVGLTEIYQRFAKGNTLLVQNNSGNFYDYGQSVSVGRWAWSSVFADIDNDGWEDIVVANGYITGSKKMICEVFWRQVVPLGNAGIGPGIGNSDPARQLQLMVRSGLSFSGNESHVIFKNEKGKSFKDISSISGLDQRMMVELSVFLIGIKTETLMFGSAIEMDHR